VDRAHVHAQYQVLRHGDPRNLSVTSWSGTVETKAQDITLADFVIGQHHLKNLRLPAVDLSAIGHACGKRIDGVLGVDLLARLGATVDIKTTPPNWRLTTTRLKHALPSWKSS